MTTAGVFCVSVPGGASGFRPARSAEHSEPEEPESNLLHSQNLKNRKVICYIPAHYTAQVSGPISPELQLSLHQISGQLLGLSDLQFMFERSYL